MARLYSTGRVIDILAKDEVAECMEGVCKGAKLFYQNIEDRGYVLMMKYPEGEISKFHPTYEYKNCKWKILRNYVDAAEAMRNVKAGHTVIFHGEGEDNLLYIKPDKYNKPIRLYSLASYSLRQLLEGKWSVKKED